MKPGFITAVNLQLLIWIQIEPLLGCGKKMLNVHPHNENVHPTRMLMKIEARYLNDAHDFINHPTLRTNSTQMFIPICSLDLKFALDTGWFAR